MNITFSKLSLPKSGPVVFGIQGKSRLCPSVAALDKESGGSVRRAIDVSHFKGKKNQILEVIAPHGLKHDMVFFVGLGNECLSETELQDLGGSIYACIDKLKRQRATIMVDFGSDPTQSAAHLAYGAKLRSYTFSKYKTNLKENSNKVKKLIIAVNGEAKARNEFNKLGKLAEGVFLCRDLVTEPPNILYPATFAAEVRKLKRLGVKVDILGEAAMRKLGMGALLGVGQGSRKHSQLAVMKWNGGLASQKPVAFIGKGVTFDTGGISLKPGAGMADMKWDMGGAGAVAGLMKALAGRKAKVNAVGILGLVENMPDGDAQRPGDVVTTMSGHTVEILNTDAEGRLVLADALWYCQKKFKPCLMIDLATLTGAILVALAKEYGGLFSNNDELSNQLISAGKGSGEKVWRMPLSEIGGHFDKMIDSKIADMKNIGGRYAGSTTAAQFLQRFVNGVPWAHLDIAGMAWAEKTTATVPEGGTGYGVRLLDRFVRDNFE